MNRRVALNHAKQHPLHPGRARCAPVVTGTSSRRALASSDVPALSTALQLGPDGAASLTTTTAIREIRRKPPGGATATEKTKPGGGFDELPMADPDPLPVADEVGHSTRSFEQLV